MLRTLQNAMERLHAAQNANGSWTGELSASALATATAVCALRLGGAAADSALIDTGLRWLAGHANADGGWGDTPESPSNISTSTLCWAVLRAADAHEAVTARGQAWLAATAGDITPEALARAIYARYGGDRTFATPILTLCALCGVLGEGRAAWRHVIPLPFELATLPQGFYRFVRMPVVSYALPALIAIGLVRFRRCAPRNPVARLLRSLATRRVLRKIADLQPPHGGFLEATPLTAFVTMSLIAAGETQHPVVQRGLDFLRRAARPEGCWPIDTNLATWVTTLAVNALAHTPRAAAAGEWLLRQQFRTAHPYTDAAPGGWAWTDLPGGVPDADDTAGALLALHRLGLSGEDARRAVEAGMTWLLDLANTDGGLPTFSRGWGYLPFDRSCPDITIHALRAFAAWRAPLPRSLQARVDRATRRGLSYLRRSQRADGSWVPLWFGNTQARGMDNPVYGTARVVLGLAELVSGETSDLPDVAAMLSRGSAFLAAAQGADGGWGGDRGAPASIEETALAVEALCACVTAQACAEAHDACVRAVAGGVRRLRELTEDGRHFPPAPIGLYFAKLWYHEKLYPVIFTVAALRRANA